jgi:hypothetical protein
VRMHVVSFGSASFLLSHNFPFCWGECSTSFGLWHSSSLFKTLIFYLVLMLITNPRLAKFVFGLLLANALVFKFFTSNLFSYV